MIPYFPEFKKIELDDKAIFNDFVKSFPPFSDISFATLNIWWNLDGNLKVSQLENNLIVNYDLPFDAENSGLGLIGLNNIDESINVIFEYLRSINLKEQLVHTPEYTIKAISSRETFELTEELDYNEYVLGVKELSELDGRNFVKIRNKVRKFLDSVVDHHLEIKEINLNEEDSRQLVIKSIEEWEAERPPRNDPERLEHEALRQTLAHHRLFEIENLCIFIDGKLHAITLFHRTHDGKYMILHHLRIKYGHPYISDFLLHSLSKMNSQGNCLYINMEMDLGLENLRRHKSSLRPVGFIRKYRIRPNNRET